MKRFLAIFLILLLTFCGTSCYKQEVPKGVYKNVENEEEEIIILKNNKIKFKNFDWTDLQNSLLSEDDEILLSELFKEEVEYSTALYDYTIITVEINEGMGLIIDYLPKQKSLKMSRNKIFKLERRTFL